MKKLISLSLLFVLTVNNLAISQIPNFQWAKKIGINQQDEGNDLAVDKFGNVITIGTFRGTPDFDPGPGTFTLASAGQQDIFISKLDALGNFVWAKRFGNANDQYGNSIAVDSAGNIYTTGYFDGSIDFDPGSGSFVLTSTGSYDFYVQKLYANGNFAWAKSIGCSTSFEEAYTIDVDDSANVYVGGQFNCMTVDFDPGPGVFNLSPSGAFILKLDSTGNFRWAKQLGGTNTNVTSIRLDSLHNSYVAGFFTLSGDFDSGPGTQVLTSKGIQDAFIAKFDPSGNFIFAKQIGGKGFDKAYGITVDDSLNIYFTGHFGDTCDFDPGIGTFTMNIAGLSGQDIFVEKLNTAGNFVWAKKMGGTSGIDETGLAIGIDNTQNIYTTGRFTGNVDFDPGPGSFFINSGNNTNIFIQKLTSNGNFVWATQFGSGSFNTNMGKSIAVDPLNNVYCTGSFVSNVDFDPSTSTFMLSSSGGYDCFILKLGIGVPTHVNIIHNNHNVLIFPNPNNGKFGLKIEKQIHSGELIVFNKLGQKIYENEIHEGLNHIHLEGIAQGIYYFTLTDNEIKFYSGKILVD